MMDAELAKRIGFNIKIMRLKRNETQATICKLFGISQTHMSNIEAGRALLTLKEADKLSQHWNCTIDEIVNGEKAEQKKSYNKYTEEEVLQAILAALRGKN